MGFFYLEGHGIATEEIDHLHHLAKDFFSLPEVVKARWAAEFRERFAAMEFLKGNGSCGSNELAAISYKVYHFF